ncbi:uncharacterized protein [Centruroides vittatus]|uniref:uncharacterized protein n=1 Tax=Centruroides vittatus TaxID=120091 RepID=UPI0035107298
MNFILLSEILKYAACSSSSRNFIEGEQLLLAGHVILCGIIEKNEQDRSVHFCALCLQTSALTSVPHRITGFLKFIDLSYKIDSITCSCKAGQSGKCKHCLAVLLFLNRNNIEGLEKLSKTDLECSWNRLKENVQSNYEIISIKKFCHTGSNNSRIALNIDSEKCLNILTEAMPNSSLTKHMKGRKSLASLSEINREINRVDQNNDVNAIFSHVQNFNAI